MLPRDKQSAALVSGVMIQKTYRLLFILEKNSQKPRITTENATGLP